MSPIVLTAGVVGTCGGEFVNQTSGYIASPGYPEQNYPDEANCTYVIKGPIGHVISVPRNIFINFIT